MSMDMISDIETTDIKASFTVSRLLWSMLNTAFAGDDDEDALSFYDKELIDDILRFGTIAEVSRRKGVSYNSLKNQLSKVLMRLERKIKWFEIKNHQFNHDYPNLQNQLDARNQQIKELQLEIIDLKVNLHLLQTELHQEKDRNTPETMGPPPTETDLETLRKMRRQSLQEAEKYKMKYESAQQTIAELKRENSIIRRHKNSAQAKSEREEKLKRRIISLENLILRYKEQGREVLKDFEIVT